MRYLILSDLHANREALDAVLADARGQYDRIVCCGDIAGYGPDPNEVIDWARANIHAGIRGNHDRGCTNFEDLQWFNPTARAACLWTAARLTPTNFEYLRDLPAGPVAIELFQLAHGSPLDEDEYVLSLSDARPIFSALETNMVFFGHTHIQGAFTWMHGRYLTIDRPSLRDSRGRFRLEADAAYLINPGSVGQPRDGDPRAAWALFDSDSGEVILCRTRYDVAATARKIIAAGLPDVLATRLVLGR